MVKCERVVVAYEKGIFYGAVLARGGIFFYKLICDWQGAAKNIRVFGRLFLLFKEGYEGL